MLNITKQRLYKDYHSFVVLAFFLIFCIPGPSGAQGITFPMPEDYLPSGDVDGYLKKANAFLENNPGSKFAPRVALDILMVANNTSNTETADAMKAYLLFKNPRSLQGSHVVSTFKEVKDFRKFITEQADVRLKSDPEHLPREFTRLVAIGLKQYKRELLDDDAFLVRAHCFAQVSGETEIIKITEPALREECSEDEDLNRVVKVHLDKEISNAQKVVRLHGKGSEAAFLEKFYISRLSSSEKKRPEITRILAENAINSREYEQALALIETITDGSQNDPQVLFWKAWTSFCLDKNQQAKEILEKIVNNHPKDKWATIAGLYSEGITHFSEYRKANVEEILSLSNGLKKGIGIMEANLEYVADSGGPDSQIYTAYLGIIPDDNRVEIYLYKGESLFVAYRTTASRSEIYLQSEPNILAFRERGPIPSPSLSISRDDEGQFSYSAGFHMRSSVKEAGENTSTFFESPYVSTAKGVEMLLSRLAKHSGWIPSKPVSKNNNNTYTWYIPSTNSPEIKGLDYQVTEDHKLIQLKSGNFCIQSLNYGSKNAFQLKPPSWPDLPVKESEEFDFKVMMRLIATLIGIL